MVVMSGFITNGELRIEAERLCDENELLQKLVRMLIAHAEQAYAECGDWSCAGCQYYDECDGWHQLLEEARGLGVEVP